MCSSRPATTDPQVATGFDAQSPAPAQFGLQVSGYASTPYNVAVGGTDFNDLSNPSTYWNTPTTQRPGLGVKSYIPESTWNDSCTNAILGTVRLQHQRGNQLQRLANHSGLVRRSPGGSGGASNCTTPSGATVATCAGDMLNRPGKPERVFQRWQARSSGRFPVCQQRLPGQRLRDLRGGFEAGSHMQRKPV